MNHETLTQKAIPALNNTELIPQIFNLHFAGRCQLSIREKIGVVLRLFDPGALDGSKPIDRGILFRLFSEIEIHPKQLVVYLVSAPSYMMIYRSFKDAVETKAKEIGEYYSKK